MTDSPEYYAKWVACLDKFEKDLQAGRAVLDSLGVENFAELVDRDQS